MTSPPFTARRARRFPWLTAAVCAFVGALLFQFFGNANRGYIDTASLFYWWGFQWTNANSETQHGWLILGISGFLFWRNLSIADRGLRIADLSEPKLAERNPPWCALAALVAGLALHALGFAVQQARLSILALLLFTWGVLRLGGGRRWSDAAAFPLAFLVFAIPLNVLDSVGFWLRLWVIKASAGLAHAAGIAVVASGTQLSSPDGRYQYDVAAACSGVRSLMALAALSLLLGYLSFRSWRRRAFLLLLCFPLVYVGNVARIATIIFVAQAGGQKSGEVAHDIMGFGVFAIVLGGVFAAARLMEKFWPETQVRAVIPNRPGSENTDENAERPNSEGGPRRSGAVVGNGDGDARERLGTTAPTLVAAGVVLFVALEMAGLHRLGSAPMRGDVGVAMAADGLNPVELPTFLGTEWIGRRTEVTAIEREILPPDTGFSRKIYVPLEDRSRAVFVSIVLSGRDRTSIHRPELCLVGQGWTLLAENEHRFRLPPDRPPGVFSATLLRVRREMTTPRGREVVPQLVAYWFVSGDGIVATHWQRLLHDAWNRVRHLRADRWAYVLVQTDARDGEPAALGRIQAVLNQTMPVFQPAGLLAGTPNAER
jgi:EpsI family protein